ncbi:18486_t:CDS:2 [Racocetra fulgida]|uniref:18486_t:CDS:1 n=1 Tax=Racocetra fulgida TaxID=60492 RepID=A0A9N9B0Z2_9GLOM|nr:18486_t:CDS:2 [Racocetra fulgida]
MTKRLLYYLLDPDDILREHLSRYFPFNETSISRHSQRPISPPLSREGTPRSSYETASVTENQMSVESPCQLIEETHIQAETDVSSPKEKFQYENFEKPSKNEFRFTDENENFESFTKPVTSAIQHETANVEMDVTSTTVESSSSDKLLEGATEPIPLSPDIRMVKINGLEVFSTKIKVGETEVQILRRVDTNCVDKFSLIQIAAKLNIEEKLGKFLDPRLFDYFDVDLDLPVPTGTCCGPLAGFAYWFQCVNPKKIFLG